MIDSLYTSVNHIVTNTSPLARNNVIKRDKTEMRQVKQVKLWPLVFELDFVMIHIFLFFFIGSIEIAIN